MRKVKPSQSGMIKQIPQLNMVWRKKLKITEIRCQISDVEKGVIKEDDTKQWVSYTPLPGELGLLIISFNLTQRALNLSIGEVLIHSMTVGVLRGETDIQSAIDRLKSIAMGVLRGISYMEATYPD